MTKAFLLVFTFLLPDQTEQVAEFVYPTRAECVDAGREITASFLDTVTDGGKGGVGSIWYHCQEVDGSALGNWRR